MADLYLYLWTFWWWWWPALPTAFLFGTGETLAPYLPCVKEWLDMIPPSRRRPIEVAILFLITLYAGFATWHGERAKLAALVS
jgi:hypothetical protein